MNWETKTPVTHDIRNLKIYPNHHFYEASENVINLFANCEVMINDLVSTGTKKFKILAILNLQDEEVTEKGKGGKKTAVKGAKPKFNRLGISLIKPYLEEIMVHTKPETLYYELRLETVVN